MSLHVVLVPFQHGRSNFTRTPCSIYKTFPAASWHCWGTTQGHDAESRQLLFRCCRYINIGRLQQLHIYRAATYPSLLQILSSVNCRWNGFSIWMYWIRVGFEGNALFWRSSSQTGKIFASRSPKLVSSPRLHTQVLNYVCFVCCFGSFSISYIIWIKKTFWQMVTLLNTNSPHFIRIFLLVIFLYVLSIVSVYHGICSISISHFLDQRITY